MLAYLGVVHNAADIVIRRTSTAQQVADGLTAMILEGRVAPGTPIKESVIATELGVSRNTVREAVRILELGGLVRHEMHRGAVVIAPSAADLAELYRARLHLEVAAARQEWSEPALQPVRAAFTALQAAAATARPHDIVRRDLAFHSAIVDLLGSERISGFHRRITRELSFFVMVLSAAEGDYERPERLVDDHRPILAALESRDPARAVQTITAHLQTNAERLQTILKDADRQSPEQA